MSNWLILLFLSALLACGVKGDPQPPMQPAFLGRGKPTYDQATQEILEKEKKREETQNQKKK